MNLSTMAPNHHHFMLNPIPIEPVSRTYQYRKIMKPMLERKRRARINKCLDELKDLMTGTLQADGENVSKLEKADILELTVRHLHRLREHNSLFLSRTHMLDAAHGSSRTHLNSHTSAHNTLNVEKFWAGFQHCAAEVSQFLNKYDRNISGELIKHIASYMPNLMTVKQPPAPTTAIATRTAANFAATTPTANYQRCQMAVNQAAAPFHCQRREGYVRVKLEPEVKQQEEEELDVGVWRPW